MKTFENHKANPFAGPLFIGKAVGDGSFLKDVLELRLFQVGQLGSASGLSLTVKSGQAVCFQPLFPSINGRGNGFEGVNDFRDFECLFRCKGPDFPP